MVQYITRYGIPGRGFSALSVAPETAAGFFNVSSLNVNVNVASSNFFRNDVFTPKSMAQGGNAGFHRFKLTLAFASEVAMIARVMEYDSNFISNQSNRQDIIRKCTYVGVMCVYLMRLYRVDLS